MSKVFCATCGEPTSTDGTICPGCSEDHENAHKEKVATLQREIEAERAKVARYETALLAIKRETEFTVGAKTTVGIVHRISANALAALQALEVKP